MGKVEGQGNYFEGGGRARAEVGGVEANLRVRRVVYESGEGV